MFRLSRLLIFVLVLSLSLALGLGRADARDDREMCITFDELPVSPTFDQPSAEQVLRPILDALEKHGAKAAGFVIGQNIGASFDLLGEWLNNGNRIGNLTYSYSDLNEVSIEAFIKDIMAGDRELETMLTGFGQKPRYFRYPYLHYGTTVEAQRAVGLYLQDHDITVAHATIVVDDYLYNLSLQKIGNEPDSAEYDMLLNEYVNHVLDQVELAETQSRQLLGRSCRQILQLRANRLNAMFLDEMLTAIENMGYKFISIDRALNDPLFGREHAYFGPVGVGYLQMIEQSNPDLLPAGE